MATQSEQIEELLLRNEQLLGTSQELLDKLENCDSEEFMKQIGQKQDELGQGLDSLKTGVGQNTAALTQLTETQETRGGEVDAIRSDLDGMDPAVVRAQLEAVFNDKSGQFDALLASVGSKFLPVGAYIDCPVGTPFDGTLECDGSALSRTDYPALFAFIGTTFGAGDGSTTFNLPDFRDRYARSGSADIAGQENAAKGKVELKLSASPSSNLSTGTVTTVIDPSGNYGAAARHYGATRGSSTAFYSGFEISGRVTEDPEPASLAVMKCIKY